MRRPLACLLAATTPLVAGGACGARTGLRVPHDASIEDASVEEAAEEEGSGGTGGVPDRPRADKIDLLLDIDGSGSMGDKQSILANAVPDLVKRLTNPRCVDASGNAITEQPASALEKCPSGSKREFNPVQNLHVGVISSNLGMHGASGTCTVGIGFAHENDRAHLLDRGADGLTYQDLGFLAWDPDGQKQPPGLSDPAQLEDLTRRIIRGVGELGCSVEAPLEAWYRFLVDPEPPESVGTGECPEDPAQRCARLQGIDQVLLDQRADFLRPDSLVAVLLLSDENDCSVIDGGRNFRVLEPDAMPRATTQCQTNPTDPCCRSCADTAVTDVCPDVAADPECQKGEYTADEDGWWKRCWDQKRRYGHDFLQPVQRYVDGLTKPEVPGRDGALVPNPLYSDLSGGAQPPRHPSLVFFAALVGVPWQDLAKDPLDQNELHYRTAAELTSAGAWDWIVGQPEQGIPPSDPLMIESIDERSGTNPATGAALAPSSADSPTANPINGHEMQLAGAGFGLQYACVFELEAPRDCKVEPLVCDCRDFAGIEANPICQADDGSYGMTQYRAKAYPGRRQLEVLHGIGENAIVASICARNVSDPDRQDYGYRPALQAILDRLGEGLF